METKNFCPYMHTDCEMPKKIDASRCLGGYESCHEYQRILHDIERDIVGIGAMVDYKHVVQGRFSQ